MKHYDEKKNIQLSDIIPDIVDTDQLTHSDNSIKQELDEYTPSNPSVVDHLKENVNALKESRDEREDSKHIIDQFTDENDYIWPKENFAKPSPIYQIKTEKEEHLVNVDTQLMSENLEDIDYEEVKSIEFNHLKLEKNECNLCDFNLETERTSDVLVDVVHQTKKKYHCNFSVIENILPYCIKSFQLKKKNFECDFCDLKYSSKQNLKNHFDAVHLLKKDHSCGFCSSTFTTKQDLKRHTDEVHLKKKEHQCKSCTYRTSKKSNFQRHFKSIHMKLRDYKCDFCNSSFTTNQTLKRHIDSVHLKKWEHQCQFCDYRPFTKFSLQRHLKSVHLQMK